VIIILVTEVSFKGMHIFAATFKWQQVSADTEFAY
jgi:hypothetical protein